MIIKNIPNRQQLAELFLKYRVGDIPFFKTKVQSNPFGEGTPQWLWSMLQYDDYLVTATEGQHDIDGVDYAFAERWDEYEGKYDLDTAPFQNIKPEVYKEGDVVEVLENVKLSSTFHIHSISDRNNIKNMVGHTFQISSSHDNNFGVSYKINGYTVPHYAVRKIVDFNDIEKSEAQETTTIEVTKKELEIIKKIREND
jgi:hypothetical protein